MNIKKLAFTFSIFFALNLWIKAEKIQLSGEEFKLANLVNQYRATYRLPAIPVSVSLTKVASLHTKDLNTNPPSGDCNMHSWSENGSWTPCCYTPDHENAECMWNKPRELTNYQGNGYEISYGAWGYSGITAEMALKGWKESSGHNNVIINQSGWKDVKWNAMGISIQGSYAVIWFGEEEDPSGYISDNQKNNEEPNQEITEEPQTQNDNLKSVIGKIKNKEVVNDITSQGIKFFQGNWKQLLAEAKKQGKPFFVDFYAVWCGPCKKMASTTFKDTEVGKVANANFLAYQIDAEQGEGISLSNQYRIRAYPTLIFFDKNGKVIGTEVGFQNARDFIETLKKYQRAK